MASRIDWTLPPVRGGLFGLIDRIAGPGATKTELMLQIALPTLAAVAAYFYVDFHLPFWPWWKAVLFCLIAFDMVGGIITNSTSSAKRWYHREELGPLNLLGFTYLHIAHVVLVGLVFRNFDYFFVTGLSGYLVVASAVVVFSPLYLQRSVALFLFAIGIILDTYVWVPTDAMAWFTPLLLLKLLIAHLPREEPYRPNTQR